MKLTLSDFDYNLPRELIAQEPSEPRDAARLLVLNKKTGVIEHRHFYDLPEYLKSGDVLVLNNTRVFPARLIGEKKASGGKVEIFLLHKSQGATWQCLIGGKVRPEAPEIIFPKKLAAQVLRNNNDGTWEVKFNKSGSEFMKIVESIGLMPLPPYIKRDSKTKADLKDYQTVFADAKKTGSVAAPTAGLHFTPALLKKIKTMGVEILEVTLHVGLGTFSGVKTENLAEHKMHAEFIEIKSSVIKKIKTAKLAERRVIAVGTTACRALETLARAKDYDENKTFTDNTEIFIYPPQKLKLVDALITNFHLPKSTLLMLVSSLAGKANIDKAYEIAVNEKYRFFSYGDAMFIK
ncbi:MAG: tRNA preQ1(34) S-adenosylmethionine ribosyltransferase-isomerase QueA [Candidatus Falkowbacteria bacterium]